MGVKFYLFFDALRNELYVSLPAEKLVFKLDIVGVEETAKIIPLAGNGQTCKGNGLCGDNNEAVKASLTYPKVHHLKALILQQLESFTCRQVLRSLMHLE